jgi:GntR family transcriptional regulator, rspAB operon transcriptional repressor
VESTGQLAPLIERPDSLTSRVYESIREAIITRALPPGSRVSEARLAESLQVSKTPVREALLRLAHAGLIVSDGQRGGLVPEPSTAALRAAYELREALEAQTARLAARNADEGDVGRMTTAAEGCLRAATIGDLEGFRTGDKQFHLAVAEASRNKYLRNATVDAYDLVWTLRMRDSPVAGTAVACAHEHQDVLTAIVGGEEDRARQLMISHVRKIATSVLGAMPGDDAVTIQGETSSLMS